jgi:response regulator RpfG family c-di-GMP phosphodiesterase
MVATQPHSYTLLFVDDEIGILNSLRRLFRHDGYRILLATNAQEALSLLKDNAVSVIVSDQRMPEMSGAELLAQSIHITPHAIRILLTGYSDIEDVVHSINEGQIFRYLNKPWNDTELRHTILQALVFHDLSRRKEGLIYDLKNTIAQLQKQNAALLAHNPERNSDAALQALQALQAENDNLRRMVAQRDALLHSWRRQLDDALTQLQVLPPPDRGQGT